MIAPTPQLSTVPTPVAQPATQSVALDPQVVNLAKSIRQTESGNNFNAAGDYVNGVPTSKGAYQWQDATWKAQASQILGDPNAAMSPANQNAVAYGIIKSWKDQGLNPAQIAAKWNSGHEVGWENMIGTNPDTKISYNVPAYVNKVMTAYQGFKEQTPQQPTNPLGTATAEAATGPDAQTAQPEYNATAPAEDWLSKAADIFGSIFGGNQIGNAIGGQITKDNIVNNGAGGPEVDYSKLTPAAIAKLQAEGVPTNTQDQRQETANQVAMPTTAQIVGDLGKVALTAGSSLIGGEELTAAGRIGLSGAIGAGLGATNALANQQDLGTGTLIGAGTGLAGGAVGELIGNVLGTILPKALVKNVLGNSATEQDVITAMDKGSFTVNGLAAQTQKDMNAIDGEIQTHLNFAQQDLDKATAAVPYGSEPEVGDTERIFNNALEGYTNVHGYDVPGFPNSNYTVADLYENAQKLIPQDAKLLEKFAKGEASLPEINELRSDLAKSVQSVYTKTALPPEKKMLGAALEASMRDYVQATAPDTQTLFEEYSKNLELNKVIKKAVNRTSKPTSLSMADIVKFIAGHSIGGVPLGLAAVGGSKALGSSAVDLTASKVLSGLQPLQEAGTRLARAPIINAISSAR